MTPHFHACVMLSPRFWVLLKSLGTCKEFNLNQVKPQFRPEGREPPTFEHWLNLQKYIIEPNKELKQLSRCWLATGWTDPFNQYKTSDKDAYHQSCTCRLKRASNTYDLKRGNPDIYKNEPILLGREPGLPLPPIVNLPQFPRIVITIVPCDEKCGGNQKSGKSGKSESEKKTQLLLHSRSSSYENGE